MTVAIVLLTFTVLGIPPAVRLAGAIGRGGQLGLAMLLGSGIGGLALLLTALSTFWSLPLAAAVAIAIATALTFVPPREEAAELHAPAANPLSWLVDAMTSMVVLGQAVHATLASPTSWDYWAIWGLKAKRFFHAGGIDFAFLGRAHNDFTHPDYPIHLPMLYDLFALAQGDWDDRWFGLLNTYFAIATLLVIHAWGRAATGNALHASLITLAVAGPVVSVPIGLAEGPLIAYFAAALLLLQKGLSDRSAGLILSGSISLGFAALTKNEGMAAVVATATAIGVVLMLSRETDWRRRLTTIALLLPAILLPLVWIVPREILSLETDLFRGAGVADRAIGNVASLGALITALGETGTTYPLLWLVTLLLLLLSGPRRIAPFSMVLIAISIQLVFYLGAYLVTPHDIIWHVTHSWRRLAVHLLIPLAVIAGAAASMAWQSTEANGEST